MEYKIKIQIGATGMYRHEWYYSPTQAELTTKLNAIYGTGGWDYV